MLEKTTKLFEEMDELMKDALATLDIEDMLEDMDENTLKLYKAYMKLYKDSKELALCQAKMIEDQNAKLDKIIKLLEKK